MADAAALAASVGAALTTSLPLLLAGLGGGLLGTAFYGGLWWTVRAGLSSPRPTLWFIGSGLLRTGVALGGIWLIGHGHWERLALSLLGFVVARPLVRWRTGRLQPGRLSGRATPTIARPDRFRLTGPRPVDPPCTSPPT